MKASQLSQSFQGLGRLLLTAGLFWVVLLHFAHGQNSRAYRLVEIDTLARFYHFHFVSQDGYDSIGVVSSSNEGEDILPNETSLQIGEAYDIAPLRFTRLQGKWFTTEGRLLHSSSEADGVWLYQSMRINGLHFVAMQCDRFLDTLDLNRSVTRESVSVLQTSYQLIWEVHNCGKCAIPYLIDRIRDTTRARFTFKPPNADPVPEESDHMFLGEAYAYLIDLILAREYLVEPWEDWMNPLGEQINCLYRYGNLAKRDQQGVARIVGNDLVEVQSLYDKWWNKNKDLQLAELRKKFAQRRGPLSSTPYLWR